MTTRRTDTGGPYLSAAFFCEKVLVEQDNVKSVVRIIDRVTHTVLAPSPPQELTPFPYNMTLFMRFKSGRARGTYTLEVQPTKPSGEAMPANRNTILFEGEDDRGVDTIINTMITFDQVGIYWFNISLNDERITRIPFRVVYMPQVRQIPHRPDTSQPE